MSNIEIEIITRQPVSVEPVNGPPGPQGVPGPPGGTLTIPIPVPDTIWSHTHSLGYYPSVTTVDSSGRVIEGDVTYPNASTVVVAFSAPFSGTMYLS